MIRINITDLLKALVDCSKMQSDKNVLAMSLNQSLSKIYNI